ncbi:SCP2 sterol-binding domain-containing protein [Micromonospora sp. NPDC048830]|uniref:SCP2 sterol-binding domain-containing protein n=1 Tax=Micromonospora sp. NPDC048830 TaxID=3364257 RepID=UPI0037117B7F
MSAHHLVTYNRMMQRKKVAGTEHPITDFFERLGRNEVPGVEYLPHGVRGTIRFDLETDSRADQWFVTLDKGKVRVSREDHQPDAVIRGPRPLFDELATGNERFAVLFFRNEMIVEGSLGLVDILARLFPGPPSAHHPRDFVRKTRERRH